MYEISVHVQVASIQDWTRSRILETYLLYSKHMVSVRKGLVLRAVYPYGPVIIASIFSGFYSSNLTCILKRVKCGCKLLHRR